MCVHGIDRLEAEITIHKAVDQDITSLRKMIDDTHMSRMQLESEVESLTEELIYLKKSHEEVRYIITNNIIIYNLIKRQ